MLNNQCQIVIATVLTVANELKYVWSMHYWHYFINNYCTRLSWLSNPVAYL